MTTRVALNRWGVVAAGVTILICLGAAYAWGVFLLPIERQTGWSRATISFAVSVLLLVFSIFMAIGGLIEKKIGPRRTAGIGGVLVGGGWLLAAFAPTPLGLYVGYGVLAGMGTGLSYMPSIASGIAWFPDKKGLVTGIIVCGFGFGTAFLSPLITTLINAQGWRTAMIVCGIFFGLIITVAAQFLKTPAAAGAVKDSGMHREAALSPRQMLMTNSFRIMFVTYFISMIAGMMTIGHLIAFMSDKKYTALQGALALTLLSMFNGIGRIIGGYVADLWGGKKTLVLLFSAIGLAMGTLYHAESLPVIYALSAAIGLCFGGFLAVYPALTVEYFGQRDFSVNYGLIFIGYGSGCFAGPVLGGWVHDTTKSYLGAFSCAGMLALLASIVIHFFLKKPVATALKRQEER
ncbi:MAG: OFA family MFS transporter [Candidatus Omnitrophica bacterium]|nr:OFA family MFS transporter [Candidatus Omnitrophota bacterium]